MNYLRTEFHDALRGLRSGRSTTLLAFLILTVTMAAATVTFSVVYAVALRPLPYGSPERLVSLSLPAASPGGFQLPGPLDYFWWLDRSHSFESLGAARFAPSLELETDGQVEALTARMITANLFEVLGVRPAAGRFFGPEHERPGGPPGVILSHDLWMRRFQGDRRVIGRPLFFSGGTREVVGVLPAGVSYPIVLSAPADLYLPYVVTAAERTNPGGSSMFVVGRLKPGVSVEQARAEVQSTSSAVVVPLHDQVVGPAGKWMVLVLAAVGLVLLVACGNVASLLLARAMTRMPEFATREALGASRRRLAVGLLLEGLMLALAAAALGIVLSLWGVAIAKSILPPLARDSTIAVDGQVLFVCFAAAALCGLVFASAPAWLASRSNLFGLMKTGGGALVGDRRRDRSLSAFLVADMAFVCVLLVATTLVVASFRAITTADLGFDRQNVMSIWYLHALEDVPKGERPAAVATLRSRLIDLAKSVPGVTSAAITSSGPPLSGSWNGVGGLIIPGFGEVGSREAMSMRVTPDYFKVMGIQLVRGRMFEPADHSGAPNVMLINDVAARRFFPDRDPIGQTATLEGPATIVGVVKGTSFFGPEAEVRPEIFQPLAQEPYRDLLVPQLGGASTVGGLLVRTSRDARGAAPAVREAIRPGVTLLPNPTQFVDEYFTRLTAVRRLNAGLMGVFGLIAVLIGALGVYGTMAFFVARRARGIGLRMALGASSSRIMRSVLRDALRRVVFGVGIGLTGAWAVSTAFTSLVFGISPTEPLVYAAVGGFLAVVGLAAAFVPARRASRLDPLVVLRQE